MKSFTLSVLLALFMITITGCSTNQPAITDETIEEINLDGITYQEVAPATQITVNGEEIVIEDKLLQIGDVLVDTELDIPSPVFDNVEQTKISDKAATTNGYTLIYSVPSLDTPVCTLQTKQIEAAAKKRPNVSFVVVSHDTPFALKRFCGDNNITNVLTLSDARTREFAKQNGLFMPKYGIMTRAVIVVDANLNVVYVDYGTDVTHSIDLLNAFGFLQQVGNQS